MTPDPTPPGTHPTDAMLLLLGDVRSDADASEFVAELQLEAASGTVTVDDPFAPALVADAWSHLGACQRCSSRRLALFVELVPVISSAASEAALATSAVDRRVGAAVAELVPTTGAVPESLVRSLPPRRRWFAGRGGAGIGAASGRGGTIAHPWIAGVALAALLLAVGAAFALRPRTTEQSAVGTVPPRVEQGSPSDTTVLEERVFAETEAAAETVATLGDAMAAEPAASGPSIAAAPAATANPKVDAVAPEDAAAPPAPEAATGNSVRPPVAPSPARASSKTSAESADAAVTEANTVQPQPAKKKASAPPTVASAAAATAPLAVPEQPTADLGTFTDAQSALDRFGARATSAVPADGTSTQLGQQSPSGNTAGAAAAQAVAPSNEPVVCPTVKGSPRLAARIVDRPVLIVRLAEAATDVVFDALTCVEITRRSVPPTTAPAG